VALRPVLFFGDVHCPYHDARAWKLMLKVARWLKPYTIVCLGDMADFYSVSSHDKSRERAASFDWELAEVRRLVDDVLALGARDLRYIEGNHEDRLQRYLASHPELAGVVSTDSLLGLRRGGWAFTPYKRTTKLGKLHLTHDVGVAGRNAAFKALDTYQHSVVSGHTHRLQYIVEGNAVGEVKLSAAFGWLGDVEQIDYMHNHKARKDWALGFGVGYHDTATDYVYVTPVPIVDYTCCVNGKLFRQGPVPNVSREGYALAA
jgi:predicted phosphodiesterase